MAAWLENMDDPLFEQAFGLGYELSLMSIDSFDKLSLNTLDNKPYLLKNEEGKYQVWGFKENKWQLTDIGNLEIDFVWKQDQKVFISPKDNIFNTLMNKVIFMIFFDYVPILKFSDILLRNNRVERFMEMILPYQDKHGHGMASVFLSDSGEFIGQAGIFHIGHYDLQPEIGYRFYKKYWSKDYATEVVNALVKWGFQHLDIDTIVSFVEPENIASKRVLEKCNFKFIGIEECYYGLFEGMRDKDK
ncbi:GNAT family N-acetyltransferase [Legionella impletisoli]|uniref:N-acetyltransferase domain-containing protein n=1 Tax=Legionella impletisoli TaxID=343510 RepID=A0A917NCS6_9GAMM|nr:GNAT family N-acetyltransferase [Legionella impletisoli]GGI87785.1 hypothetical protein GCM10007966_15650 [Legionella impletisoli]